ncbi:MULTISPECIES: hypothetical protein [Methylotuvimicrobium]|nr:MULTISPECIES: hypothetical protein [Methylotuvimicrobium]QCW82233.1 hypothetical protein EQU24_08265 [Methylotuvimicrobium buryatense]
MISTYHPMQLTLGLIVWIVWFIVKYGALVLFCEQLPPPVEQGAFTWINATLLSGSVAVTALLLFWANNCWRAARIGSNEADSEINTFIAGLGAGINLLGAVTTLSQGLISLLLPPCL